MKFDPHIQENFQTHSATHNVNTRRKEIVS